VAERVISEQHRQELEAEGETGYGTSYPMEDCDEVQRAIEAYGRAPEEHRAQLRAQIVRRKAELGCDQVDLPKSWHI